MAISYSPKLPLGIDPRNAYGMHSDYIPMIMQNLKMVILTAPGERAMDPEFGVGIKKFLFEPNTNSTYADIKSRIVSQVASYLSYLDIIDIAFSSDVTGYNDIQPNYVKIKIDFKIKPLNVEQSMELEIPA
tara:strand:+ start:40070 stop:40462 length:393 start_codon:yes stop_codon:yes gene_type:complete